MRIIHESKHYALAQHRVPLILSFHYLDTYLVEDNCQMALKLRRSFI